MESNTEPETQVTYLPGSAGNWAAGRAAHRADDTGVSSFAGRPNCDLRMRVNLAIGKPFEEQSAESTWMVGYLPGAGDVIRVLSSH